MQSSQLPGPAWKPAAVPAEHGGWGFLARHPLRLWLLDRRTLRHRVRPQVLGFQKLGFVLLTLTLLAVGYRVGL